MQGKKQYTEQLFKLFQLSERVPLDNFYRRLKELPDLKWLYTGTKNYYGTEGHFKKIDDSVDKPLYDRMHARLQTSKAKRMKKLRSSTVEPVLGTLVNYLNMRRVNTRGMRQSFFDVLYSIGLNRASYNYML